MTTAPLATALRVRAAPAGDLAALLDHLPAEEPLAWVRDGDGLVGWGVAARLDVSGPGRFAAAQRWWDDLVSRCELDADPADLVAFGSFSFDDRSAAGSTLIVPRVLLGRRAGRAWVTTVGEVGPLAAPTPPRRPQGIRWSAGTRSVTSWREAVAEAVGRIQAGELGKVVLAYDLLASAEEPVDSRWLLQRLSERYAGCWGFAVDGLVGATPELLVRRQGRAVSSRVLAGTVRRTGLSTADERAATELLGSHKDREEHDYAVASLVDRLSASCLDVAAAAPSVLELANVLHLSTDVTATVADGSTALDLVAAVHPTAAVGGTPTADAVALIRSLEGMDRGRYAGPVGWLDARGDGEWGIALRCAEVDGRTVRLFAGCGIVAESDPDDEVAEAQAKFLPIRDALEG